MIKNIKSLYDTIMRVTRLGRTPFYVRWPILLGFTGLIGGMALFFAAYVVITPTLPDIEALKEIKLSVPLRIFTADGKLMAEYGEKKRTPVDIDKVPEHLINAFVSAEDNRFFTHGGVDFRGLLRAAVHVISTGRRGQGGSTITMQVARNFFLSREKTYSRKINEIFLSWKIENNLSKKQILELYFNKIYLGNRAYGVAAAAQVYYGKPINDLTLPQIAMIAGLPKAPSRYNPIANPRRALLRRNHILKRMNELGYIEETAYQEARSAPDEASIYAVKFDSNAPYVAEMVRDHMVNNYTDDVYNSGYRVYTTINTKLQTAANKALHNALMAYDKRHGFRGVIDHVDIKVRGSLDHLDDETYNEWDNLLRDYNTVGRLYPALVVALKISKDESGNEVKREAVVFQPAFAELIIIPWEGISWAKPFIDRHTVGDAPQTAEDVLRVGDIIYITQEKISKKVDEKTISKEIWRVAQIPEVEGAFVALNPKDGAIVSLVGGYDFQQNKFNRVIQAKRQPGSNFKPFIYSAALDKCMTPATTISNSPIVIEDAEGNPWKPENDNGKFTEPLRLRAALTRSVNLVSIRILQEIGLGYASRYAANFGFDPKDLPRNYTMALGTYATQPINIVRGYAVFANGGFLVEPYFIQRIETAKGEIIYESPKIVFEEPPEPEPRLNTMDPSGAHIGMETTNPDEVANTEPMQKPAEDSQQPQIVTLKEGEKTDTPEEDNGEPKPFVRETKTIQRSLSKNNVFLMTSIMRDVVKHGTGRRAYNAMGREDLAGKTGTTNDQVDAWFSGFNHKYVASAWVGFDNPQPMGRSEFGSRAALPMWIEFMQTALQGIQEEAIFPPPGMVTIRIDPVSGAKAAAADENAIFEHFDPKCLPQSQELDPNIDGLPPTEDGNVPEPKNDDQPINIF